jgi:phage-related protein
LIREIRFYKNYFIDFYISLDSPTQEKIEYVFKVVRTVDKVPEKFLKHLVGSEGLYEIRIKAGSNVYRVFCCFDAGKIVILFNGFQKKSQKTPRKEIAKAIKLMDEYFTNKKETRHEEN